MTAAPTLRTARLTLRPVTVADVELLADPELSRFRHPDTAGRWVFDLDGDTAGLGRLQRSTDLSGALEIDYYYSRCGLRVESVPQHGLVRGKATYMWEPNLTNPTVGRLHHVELWVPDLVAAQESWGWLLTELGWTEYQRWHNGVSWRLGPTYLVFEDSPARQGDTHDRLRPGLNHIALHAGSPERVEELTKAATKHGWRLMFADKHPYAGGPDHYAAYLENGDGYEVELVAT